MRRLALFVFAAVPAALVALPHDSNPHYVALADAPKAEDRLQRANPSDSLELFFLSRAG